MAVSGSSPGPPRTKLGHTLAVSANPTIARQRQQGRVGTAEHRGYLINDGFVGYETCRIETRFADERVHYVTSH